MTDEEKIDLSLFLNEYLNDAKYGFQRLNTVLLYLEKDHTRIESIEEMFRVFHTLKSSSAMIEFTDISSLAHDAESLLDRLRKNEIQVSQGVIDLLFAITDALDSMVKERGEGRSETSPELRSRSSELKKRIEAIGKKDEGGRQKDEVKKGSDSSLIPHPSSLPVIEKIDTICVHINILDSLFNLIGELIIAKNRLDNILSGYSSKELRATMSTIDHLISGIQENVNLARLVPVDEIFQKFPRMVRDTARGENKKIELIVEGREIELDKSVLDVISEPLIHLLRNAVGHGIEYEGERIKKGKNGTGTIRLTAKRAENNIIIEVSDDGGGIDIALMKEIAIRKGFIKSEDADLIQEKDVIKLLFAPGFSSTEDVTGLSGRGVGLNVVRTAIRELGGTVEVTTEKGKGTTFSLTLPMTTAIIQTLLVEVGNYVFAIPSDIVMETQRLNYLDIKDLGDEKAFIRGSDVIPFIALNKLLGIPGGEEKEFATVIIHRGNKMVGLGVDVVLDQMDNIIKPFDPIAQQIKGFSGGTILGDGRVALLLDIQTLFGFGTVEGEKFSI